MELPIVSDASMTLQDGYRTIREGAALVAGAPRGRIAVSGNDRASYLHGLLTNEIEGLEPGSGCYAAWLTPQGRMITDMHVLEAGDMILLDVPASVGELVLQRLDQFLFSEDVQLANVTDALRSVSVHGPRALETIEHSLVLGPDETGTEWPQYRNVRAQFAGHPVVVARIDQLGVPGFTIYVDAQREADLIAALENAGATPVDEAAIDAARVEAGYPIFGIDMDDDIIPLEAGIENRAISFTKGCYVGQEVIIRVLHRGGGRVARRLVGLRLQGEGTPPPRGTRVHGGGRDVGFVTSAAQSPRLGTIALAYVHRDFVTPGTPVEVESGTGRTAAAVSALPFGATGHDATGHGDT
jgi:tRNA-modifying protein YgfZ